MTTLGDRLRRARISAGYNTAAEAARRFGWNVVTYRAHESDMRGVKNDVAQEYCRAFRIDLEWLLTGKGDQSSPGPGAAEIIDIWDHMDDDSKSDLLDFARWRIERDAKR